MVTLFRTNKIHSFPELKSTFTKLINSLPAAISPTGDNLLIYRYEFPCEPTSLLVWLHNQNVDQKIYWSSREESFEVAGIGVADLIESSQNINYQEIFDYIEDRVSKDNPNLRYYGGFCFDSTLNRLSDWDLFKNYRFLVPRFELCKLGEETVFAFNIAIKDISQEVITQVLSEFEKIDFNQLTSYRSVPIIQSREDFPKKDQWNQIFIQAMNSIHKNLLKKIVLARESVFTFDKNLNSMALIKHLKDITPGCFHFCFQVDEHIAFLGATPERLYKKDNQNILTEALAGTKPRGNSADEEARLENELLNSSKNIQEHQLVVDFIKDILNKYCHNISIDEKNKLLKIVGGQHLLTRFKGELKKGVDNAQLIGDFHPTPAVAGSPREEAKGVIQQLEPFSRGWYAGPIGYVGYNQSEFAVAIRCGLIKESRLSLFAGAGIVEESNMEDEWNEVENKISNFIKVFERHYPSKLAAISK